MMTKAAGCVLLLAAIQPLLAETGLPLPRFASLKAEKVYLRTGPGQRYPVDWIFLRRGLPVEIVSEFEHWRRIRDWQGTEGWIHRAMLSGRRTVIVKPGLPILRSEPDPSALVIARVEESVIGRVLECAGEWCRLELAERRGWMRRVHIWGIRPKEVVN